MRLPEIASAAKMALLEVRQQKVRSLLTVLGVVIGTGTVIAVGSIVTGVNGTIEQMALSWGPDTIFGFQFSLGFRGNITAEEFKRKPFTLEEARALEERCPAIRHTAPYLFSPNSFAEGGNGWTDRASFGSNELYNIELAGTEEGYISGEGSRMLDGRFFTQTENQHHAPVVVIGEHVYKSLFRGRDALGKWIKVNGTQLQVVGVAGYAIGFPGQEDRRVLLPYYTMHKIFPNARQIMFIIVAFPGKVNEAIDQTETVMRQLRKTPPAAADDFWFATGSQMLDDFHRITEMVVVVMVGLSSIGLLVGGIGVMNIMLVSVTERTREIGIRKAVGATRADITMQFLIEAVVLTGLGGLLGMTLGWMVSVVFRMVFPSLPTFVPLWAAVLGVMVSVLVGLFSGTWPAVKAARLNPVVALQYE